MSKKLFIVFAVVFTAVMMLSLFSAATAQETSYIRGDTDGNGKLNIHDVTLIQRVLANIEPDPDGSIAKRADLDGNGLGINDATLLQCYLAEFAVSAPVGETVTETLAGTNDPFELPFVSDP